MGKAAKRIKGGDIKMSTYIAKIAKKYTHPTSGDKDQLTVSKSAIMEMELLADDAIAIITRNADKILTYSGTYTLGKQTAEAATCVAFSGLLRHRAKEAGNAAVESYEAFEQAQKEARGKKS